MGVDGIVFDSKREAARWVLLKAREKDGEITDLRRQVRFPLYAPAVGQGAWVQVSEYKADFTYQVAGVFTVEDAKGLRTQMYALKAKWLELQDGIVIEEV